MTKIIFVQSDGTEHLVEANDGDSIMTAAINNDVPGIDGDCGGNCACATCHVYIRQSMNIVASEEEKTMLGIADNATSDSRLGCQISVSDNLDGLRVYLPVAQH